MVRRLGAGSEGRPLRPRWQSRGRGAPDRRTAPSTALPVGPGARGCPDDRAPAGAAIVIASVAPMTSNVHILLDEVRGYRFRETTVASRSADPASADRPLVIVQWPSKSTPSSTTITGASTSP